MGYLSNSVVPIFFILFTTTTTIIYFLIRVFIVAEFNYFNKYIFIIITIIILDLIIISVFYNNKC